MKTCKFNCSGCRAYMVIVFTPFERIILWIRKARCYKCFHYNKELEMCSKLHGCSICKCDYYTKRNNRCMKFKKSKW